jgi:hypothetical protein
MPSRTWTRAITGGSSSIDGISIKGGTEVGGIHNSNYHNNNRVLDMEVTEDTDIRVLNNNNRLGSGMGMATRTHLLLVKQANTSTGTGKDMMVVDDQHQRG